MNRPDFIDLLTVGNLKELRRYLKRDLKKDRPMVFKKDPVKDKKKIRKLIKSMTRVIGYLTR